jgi:hypothetical protein
MIDLKTARLLIISQTEADSQEIKTFIARMPFDGITARDFVAGKLVPTDDYDFLFSMPGVCRVSIKIRN